jgi:hypothetical protein
LQSLCPSSLYSGETAFARFSWSDGEDEPFRVSFRHYCFCCCFRGGGERNDDEVSFQTSLSGGGDISSVSDGEISFHVSLLHGGEKKCDEKTVSLRISFQTSFQISFPLECPEGTQNSAIDTTDFYQQRRHLRSR